MAAADDIASPSLNNGTGHSIESRRRNVYRLLRQLPDRDERAQAQERVDYYLEQVAALFFRANQKRVSGFVLFVWLSCRVCSFIHDLPSRGRRLAAMTTIITFLPRDIGEKTLRLLFRRERKDDSFEARIAAQLIREPADVEASPFASAPARRSRRDNQRPEIRQRR